ncbi:TauD/TfdA family dioxygenase [[Mycobacterium] crassicus]|uniref:TauD/TfdA family dioxygenase n=1 Tax=[Mycobacterium] crassicus TaxID=2872309 RepID=A0ABU5XMS6_9MYCO|nr:TauD/TfdA family dioxygenase [Mycolicibacter sp. MYC098]MEB3023506.1 TauD/TfdA family dioxygenase [Mycolicibacter sp. MYC098]
MVSPVPDDSPSVWTRADFPDESVWSFELSTTDRQALIDHGRAGADLGRRIGAHAAQWAELLHDGPGFVRLRNFPIDELTEQQIAHAYRGLGALLGTPVGQDRDGNIITHIRDERIPAGPTVRKYRTNLPQDFHSDGSDLVGLLCLRPAKTGGASRIASAHAIFNEMLRRDPHLLDVMYAPMPWSRNGEEGPGEQPYFELPPIIDIGGVPRIFFIAWYIRDSQQHSSAPRLTDEQLAALALVETIANDPLFHIEMDFRPGDVQLLNNTTVLHAREGYLDDDDPSLRRHLLRLWLTAHTPLANELLRGGIPTPGAG